MGKPVVVLNKGVLNQAENHQIFTKSPAGFNNHKKLRVDIPSSKPHDNQRSLVP